MWLYGRWSILPSRVASVSARAVSLPTGQQSSLSSRRATGAGTAAAVRGRPPARSRRPSRRAVPWRTDSQVKRDGTRTGNRSSDVPVGDLRSDPPREDGRAARRLGGPWSRTSADASARYCAIRWKPAPPAALPLSLRRKQPCPRAATRNAHGHPSALKGGTGAPLARQRGVPGRARTLLGRVAADTSSDGACGV